MDDPQKVLADVAAEREAQDRTWGIQNFPDGTGPGFTEHAEKAQRDCAHASASGGLTWRHLLAEEFLEALAESDPAGLRRGFVQTAAVAVRSGAADPHGEDHFLSRFPGPAAPGRHPEKKGLIQVMRFREKGSTNVPCSTAGPPISGRYAW